jgi:putative pre-16S rRNA nuclease
VALPTAGRLLGIDWGEIRIGLALSDPTQLIAAPLGTIVRRRGKRFPMPILLDYVATHGPVGVVIGLPLTPEGDEGAAACEATALAESVRRRTGLEVALWDERMSSARALRTVREMGGSTRGRKGDVDALAAAVLLQHFMEARRPRP